MIHAPEARSAPRARPDAVVLEPLPAVAAERPVDVAERLRDLPGLALLESARPGRNARWSYLTADPVALVESLSAGADPFAAARSLMARLDPGAPAAAAAGVIPPFHGGLVGYLSYDVGRRFEQIPAIAVDDQHLPPLRLALHDWVIAWDRQAGAAWLAGRAVDGDAEGLARRLAAVRARLEDARPPASQETRDRQLLFTTGLGHETYRKRVDAIRTAIADGELYQANLARRLETPFCDDPWPLYRRLRTGDPSLFAAWLDLGERRALLSASPEPFVAIDRLGFVESDPIKGTRPRGATRDEDRALAAELLCSDKDRAENTMIVDVLRNDLGRVCVPGSVRVPRLLRLERTTAVQHLVSTVTGRLAAGNGPFELLAASFPGGSITGAPKIRAMQLLESLEPVRRGPYTGALGWIGPDGAMATSILIRTFVADGSRLTLHVGGGITWGSDPDAEWEETVAKARGPLSAIGAREAAAT